MPMKTVKRRILSKTLKLVLAGELYARLRLFLKPLHVLVGVDEQGICAFSSMLVTGVRMRLYVKGLSGQVTASDLGELFGRYGSVSDAFTALDSSGHCRGFGFVSMDLDDSSCFKCISALNGSTWKGLKLQIERAGPDFQESSATSSQMQHPCISKSCILRKRWTRHAADMSPVTEKNMSKHPGWKRDRFGQPVLLVRLRKDDGSLVTFDPSHFTQDLKRFHESFRPRSLQSLSWQPGQYVHSSSISDSPADSSIALPSNDHLQIVSQFSLSKLLNLPVVTQTISSTALPAAGHTEVDKKTSALEPPIVSALFKREALKQLCAFELETTDHWKNMRSEIRRDFRSQIKDSMRKMKKQRTAI